MITKKYELRPLHYIIYKIQFEMTHIPKPKTQNSTTSR